MSINSDMTIFDDDASYESNPFHMCKDCRLEVPVHLSRKWPLSTFSRNNAANASSCSESQITELANEIDSILAYLQKAEVRSIYLLYITTTEPAADVAAVAAAASKSKSKDDTSPVDDNATEAAIIISSPDAADS